MEGTIHLRLLGTVQVERDGEPVRGFESRKALALLGYLAVQGQPVPRERLADLFWEDKSESRSRANLSWVLRKIAALLPGCLQADRHAVRFQPTTSHWLDIEAFEQLETQGDVASLAAAVELCRGEFLEGLRLESCSEFGLWLVAERERWRQRVANVLDDLVAHHLRRAEHDHALRFAHHLLALEPWREEAHRQVMRLLAWSDQRGAALAQYDACCRALAEELDVQPAPETTRLYEQIRDGALEPSPSPLALPIQPPSFLHEEERFERPLFVAREQELARLDRFLEGAVAGKGQVVFVTGDAGQGKTALIQEFALRAQSAHPDLLVADGSGNAFTGVGDPYLPFREILALLTGDVEARWSAGAISREQARRLWNTLPLTVQALVEAGSDLVGTFLPSAALVGRALAAKKAAADGTYWLDGLQRLVERKAATPSGPGPQQSDFFEQVTQVLRMLAHQRPLLVVLDDVQWADGGSISLLFHLARRIEGSRTLIVGAYRPAELALGRDGERHPLDPIVNELKRRFGDVEVSLEQAEDRRFVDTLLDTEPNRLGGAFRDALFRQTGGHPLFTIELLHGLQERGDLVHDEEGQWTEGPALDWDTLPARVEAVIAERIGRVAESPRQALRVASVEGETFTAEVVARVQGADEGETIDRLSRELDKSHRLIRAQGLEQLRAGQLSRYRFRHILFQRYLYNSLDAIERAHLHREVGTTLETLYGEETGQIGAIAGQLARHYQEAGVTEKAVDYLRQAGERAVRMSANEEAIAHFNQGLALLEMLPDTPQRAQQELALQVGLAAPLLATKGFASPEAGRAHARARELCQQLGDTPQLFPVLWHLANYYGTAGDHRTAGELAEQILDLAERAGDSLLLPLAHWVRAWNYLYLGQPARARAHHERVIATYDPQLHHALAFRYGVDPRVGSLIFLSWVLWLLGYPDQALERGREAVSLAREMAHPHVLASALGVVGIVHTIRRDVQPAKELAQACIQLSTEHGFRFWVATGVYIQGWALIEQGQVEEGIAQMRWGLAGLQATGAELGRPQAFAELAAGHAKAGQAEEGLALLDEALALVHRTGEVQDEAELHRLRGELLRMQGADEAEVERQYQQAIEVAHQQSARSWELRATIGLCRLWQDQGKREEARERLAEIYGWFTEGFDTPDLQDAQALLEELA